MGTGESVWVPERVYGYGRVYVYEYRSSGKIASCSEAILQASQATTIKMPLIMLATSGVHWVGGGCKGGGWLNSRVHIKKEQSATMSTVSLAVTKMQLRA